MAEFSINYIKSQEEEEHSTLVDYIQKHFYSTYDFSLMP